MILERTKAPVSEEIKELFFLKPQSKKVSEACNLYSIHQNDQQVIKVQFVFRAGVKYQNKPLIASFTNSLITEGTDKYSSRQIAELFDNEGAFLETECQPDIASISLFCLAKSLTVLVPLLKEIILSASFPEKEIENRIEIQRQKFNVNSQKVSFLAKNEFLPFIIGKDNSYSNHISIEHFAEITREDIKEFYTTFYLNQSFDIYLSGKVEKASITLIENEWKDFAINEKSELKCNLTITNNNEESFFLKKEGALQSAMRIGMPIIGKSHKDFPKLLMANTILGGYFGSRLMANIREDKGYTYGIGSGIITFENLAYFIISTEVGAEVTEAALNEIEKEINKMSSTLVNENELKQVKNYMNGSIMRSFDGAFSSMDRFVTLKNLGLDYSYYNSLFEGINKVTSEEIMAISKKYLSFSSMKKIIVGKV